MKNVDVPMWDKGDDTDDFSKGGASGGSPYSMGRPSIKKSPAVKKLYKQILGREPSSREMAFYKYSNAKKEDIIEKLITSDEHKEIIEKAKKYPSLSSKNKKLKSTVLKLKSKIEDNVVEQKELKKLLEEKNETIKSLRSSKNVPYLCDEKIVEENNVHYSISTGSQQQSNQPVRDDETFWDRLSYLLFGKK